VTSPALTLPEPARNEAQAILATNARNSAWGWKDPRTTLFLDFWKSLVPDARFVFMYREPGEVIESLFRRGDKAIKAFPELAMQSWICHNRIILEFARRHRSACAIVSVQSVARDASGFLRLIRDRFSLDLDVETSSTFDARALHVYARSAPQNFILRYFEPQAAPLYAELQTEADLPATGAPISEVELSEAKAAFFSLWMSHAADANMPTLRIAATVPEQDDSASQARLVTDEIGRIRDEISRYEEAVTAFRTQVDRCLGVGHANQTSG
jgi:hypothetical protein